MSIGMEKGFVEMHEWEQTMLNKHGYYCHYVEDSSFPYELNAHTHGLEDSFDHPELQIVFPLPMEVVGKIFSVVVSKIKDGHRFEADQDYSHLLKGDIKLRFVEAVDEGKHVLRVIVPDMHNATAQDRIHEDYRRQYANRFSSEEYLEFAV